MTKIAQEQLKEVLEKHQLLLDGKQGGEKADLSGADMRGAYLEDANLEGAYLSGADLRWADLPGADLRGANLEGAYLEGANLSGADMRGAYLRGANLREVIGNMQEIKSMELDSYHVVFTKDILAIGCEQHTLEKWKNFTDVEIDEMDKGKSLLWWEKWKSWLFNTIGTSFENEE